MIMMLITPTYMEMSDENGLYSGTCALNFSPVYIKLNLFNIVFLNDNNVKLIWKTNKKGSEYKKKL